jgi:heat shock protein HtpX
MTRILLFLATNIAIMILLGIVTTLAQGYLHSQGIDFPQMQLLVFATIFGFGGSFISLAVSKWVAKRATGAQVIEEPRNDAERWLVETVRQQAQAAGIGMPEVAVFPSNSPNAFATGARKDKALVAVSTGLLAGMQREEVEAVLAHEVSHVANGDMVTLTLIQGVLNVFVLFFSRIIGQLVDSFLSRGEQRGGYGIGYWVATIFAQIVLTALASIVVCWFSRRREFRADAGGARLAGTTPMVNALKRLQSWQDRSEPLPEQVAAFGISSGSALMRLYNTHPDLQVRIDALESRAHA